MFLKGLLITAKYSTLSKSSFHTKENAKKNSEHISMVNYLWQNINITIFHKKYCIHFTYDLVLFNFLAHLCFSPQWWKVRGFGVLESVRGFIITSVFNHWSDMQILVGNVLLGIVACTHTLDYMSLVAVVVAAWVAVVVRAIDDFGKNYNCNIGRWIYNRKP